MKIELVTPNLVRKIIKEEIGLKFNDLFNEIDVIYQKINQLREEFLTQK